jgi:5-methylthioribose kinase
MNDPMRLVDADSAAAYLAETGRLEPGETACVTELTGGVSNVVLLVERKPGRSNFVLKQARAELRVAEPWFCSVERIWREVEVLRICEQVLSSNSERTDAAIHATTPHLLFADPQEYLFAMSAAPPHQVWKQHLLAGTADPGIARACGDLLGQLHAGTWLDEDVARLVGDRTFFDDLRISPYYRHTANAHPALQPALGQLINSVEENCLALVHGDFSPKNLLVSDSQLMLVDFEVGHFGDPAFDLGFFLSHLVLKSLRASADRQVAGSQFLDLTVQFWSVYRTRMIQRLDSRQYDALEKRAIQHFAGCALARIDGKSPVDYLQPETQELVRRIATRLLTTQTENWSQVLAYIRGDHVGRNSQNPCS